MISSEAVRTLVKSPPELWALLSDPESLARQLVEFGEVRIVSAEPESAVAWAGQDVTGTVQLKASGWGTKVTLTATRQPPACLPVPFGVRPSGCTPQWGTPAEPEPEPAIEPEPAVEPEATAEPGTVEPEPEPAKRPGFFARLFRRRRSQPVPVQQPEAAQPEAEAASPEPEPTPEPEQPDLAAELQALEESLAGETTAALTAVLDRLGAAHHRPFSRA